VSSVFAQCIHPRKRDPDADPKKGHPEMAGHKKQCHRSRTAERQGPERTQDAGPPEVVPKREGKDTNSTFTVRFVLPKDACVCVPVCVGPVFWPSVRAC